jgi:hypothetical protein
VSRFEPPPDPSGPPDHPRPQAPARPPTVELAAAILIVGGAVNLIGAVLAAVAAWAADPFLWLTIGLNLASAVVGILVRTGRLWLVTVNFAAVLGFLDLLGASVNPAALMLGVAEILVVVILIRHKPWFDEIAAVRAAAPDRERVRPVQ